MTALESSSPSSLAGAKRSLAAWVALRIRALAADFAASAPREDAWDAMILVGEDAAEVHARYKNAVKHLASVSAGLELPDVRAVKRHLGRRGGKRLVLRLGAGQAIRTAMTLPTSAADVLPAIVANKVESIAPWPAGEALWGFRRRPAQAGSEIVEIEVAVAGRRSVEDVAARLAAAGLRVSRVEAGESAGRDDGISLGTFGAGAVGAAMRRLKVAAAVVLIVALSMALPGIYLLLTGLAELDRVSLRTAALQSELQGRTQVSDPSGRLQQALALVERKGAELPFVTILKTLTSSLPDGTWLEALDYADGQITISGKGTPTPEVIDALEMSPALARVGFAAATQREAGANVDSFSISASIEAPGAPQ